MRTNMFKEEIERIYSAHEITFGKYKGVRVEDIPVDWIAWWLNKREKDEENGTTDIDWDHKIRAERVYNFERTYIILIYALYKRDYPKHFSSYSKHKCITEKFWESMDNNESLMNNLNRYLVRDEIEAVIWACWKESHNHGF